MKRKVITIAISIILTIFSVCLVGKGIKDAVKYFERYDKYVTVEGTVRSVYRFGLGFTASVHYDYKGSGYGTYLKKRIGFAPKKDSIVKLQIDSFYPGRVRPQSSGIFKILCGIGVLVVAGYFAFFYKEHTQIKVSFKLNQKTRKILKIAVALLAAWIIVSGVVVLITACIQSRNSEWGLRLSVSDVSSKGLTLNLERNDTKNEETMMYGSDFFIQKRTLIGWRRLTPKGGYVFTSEAYFLETVDTESWNMKLEGMFGKLPIGIYRIKKTISVGQGEKIWQDHDLYATFIVIW